MRVTHVITRLIVGGAQENTIASVLGLALKPGLQTELISGPTAGSEGSLEPMLAQKPGMLTIVPSLVRPVHPWKDVLALRELTRLFNARRPDIVHTHSGKAGILGRLAAARAGVPIIIHTIHGPSFGAFQGMTSNLIFRGAERRAGKLTTHFVVVAEAMKRQYLEARIGSPAKYSTIYSGFNLEPFLATTNDAKFRAHLGLTPEYFVVGKIGRLFKLKGHEHLFAAAVDLVRAFPNIRFLLVGDGPWRAGFEARASSLGLEKHFIFTGLVAPEAVPRYVGIMDVLVHLSEREGLPRALPQAMAAAKPVIAADCDGANEVCLNGQTGFLVQPGDVRTFRERVLQLAQDAALRHLLGENGRGFVRERFEVRRMVDELHNLYVRLAASGDSGENALATQSQLA